MVQIIPAAQREPSVGQKLSQGIGRGLSIGSELMNQRQQQQAIQSYADQIGVGDISKLSPDLQKQVISLALQGQAQQKKFAFEKEQQEKKYGFQKELEEIKSKRKVPTGGLTGQPIPQEISQTMNQIIQRFPNADADQLKMMMDESGVPPAYSNAYVENRRRQDERMQSSKDKRLESGQKRAEKVLDKADVLGTEIPILESTINAMEDAVVNGDQSFWSLDNLAEMTGLELFRTAKGGQFKSAAKTYFINDLKASGARPNQFIEKQMTDALAKIGRSQEANQTVIESFKFSNDLKKKWHETARELEKYYDETIGYLPGSFSRIIEETMKPYVEERQKNYEKILKDLAVQEKNKPINKNKKSKLSGRMIDVIGPDGQEYEVDESEVELLPEGYRIG